MAEKKIILVTGATGAQGGGVARRLLSGGEFAVRALARRPDSDAARALAAAGAEVVQGDTADPASLRAAMAGCHGAFGVTNYWEYLGEELQHGKNLVEAALASGITHYIASTLFSADRMSGGTIKVPHLDIKAEVEDYARARLPRATFLHVPFYFDNFLTYFPPRRQADGVLTFGFPQGDTPLAMAAVEDVGAVVARIFAQPDAFAGRVFGLVAEDAPTADYAEVMSRVLGQTIRYAHIPREVFASFGFPGAVELAAMFEFNRLYLVDQKADLAASRALCPELLTFEQWVTANQARFEPFLRG